ncbi:metallophosphoesterase [Burkholderia cepacia]|uniref:metallophosphoesterase n=1 Tax=Burkholderia cepacia TaxID=292 RepID=UPI001C9338F0|nr:metallophosphoesterase [Burkholderia cepacia]MBY4715494.1 metallophosphoesterase [Burkholderia cepacia]MBY4741451.1 metallophosphoesterase [Burkholderia cepacia]MBY4748957.1 metallophosphoesterase [Burkholderia cepacia]MBY4758783.1 metallophosphoesterase [Burkholderia cepacia]MBY4779138.1 metallophosphoesterase [Burkholderia cepacia]
MSSRATSAVFVHVSDIHFGQEKDQRVHIHNDVKKQLIADAKRIVRDDLKATASAILVTGDIAQSGIEDQFKVAGEWLDALAEAVGCPQNQVQMVPGNHDLDRNKTSLSAEHLLDLIRAGGPAEYEKVMNNPTDRAALFARFEDYERFCWGYRCELNGEAKAATNLQITLAPGRSIRFVRMNSSLLCTGKERDDEPELVLGERQFIIDRDDGVENIVLIHHPLNWYKDSGDVKRYMDSRARVLITGHEHHPNVKVEEVGEGADLMMLAAGATVPFKSNDVYTFTYNVIELEWDPIGDDLIVTMHPRAWDPKGTSFVADDKRLGGVEPRYKLRCPNFKRAPRPPVAVDQVKATTEDAMVGAVPQPLVELVPAEMDEGEVAEMPPAVEGYGPIELRFFRDLLEGERLRILITLDAVPHDSDERMNRGLQRKLLESLAREGKLSDVERLMVEYMEERTKKGT